MEREREKHVSGERLEAYSMQSMSDDEAAGVEEHLLFCKTCQDRLQAVDGYVKAMRSAAMRVREEEKETPAVGGALQRLKTLLHAPLPICGGVVVMAGLLLMVGLQFRQRPGVPVEVELQAIRGESVGTALAGHALNLNLDNQGVRYLPAWRIQIVDSEGSKVWAGAGTWTDGGITANVSQSFTAGTYYVRLLKDTEDPVREYQLVVK